jgi:hypothetical protein
MINCNLLPTTNLSIIVQKDSLQFFLIKKSIKAILQVNKKNNNKLIQIYFFRQEI